MGVDREQVGEVDEHEDGEHEVCPCAAHQGDDQPHRGDDQGGAEALPETFDEGNRRHMVVLESEPARARVALDPPDVTSRLAEMENHERARQSEADHRQTRADRKPPPAAPRSDHERSEQEGPGVLCARGETDREACELDPAGDHQAQPHGGTERERHVGDGHPRVRDVRRLDRRHRRGDETGDEAVRALPEPPGRRNAAERDHDHRQPRGEVGRLTLPGLERRQQVHDEAWVVEPMRVEAAAVHHRPCARNHVALVGVQEGEREAVADANEAEGTRAGQNRRQRDRRAPPPAISPLRPLAAPH